MRREVNRFCKCAAFGLPCVWLLLIAGCGYRVASRTRVNQSRSIAVVPLDNTTTFFEVEQILTRALVRELVESTGYEVENRPERAEAVIEGVVTRLNARPVTFGSSSFGSTFLVTLQLSIRVTERASGRILFENPSFVFREQYVINVDVENFFTELNPALERIASDAASSVVTTLRESF